MTKRTKIIIAVVAVLLIAVVLYFVVFKKKPTEDTVPLPDGSLVPVSEFVDESFPLNVGMKGDNVRRLQVALNRIKPDVKINEDGLFGSETKTKLSLSVAAAYSVLPMKETTLNTIIALGNKA